jgi:hypothetical protein
MSRLKQIDKYVEILYQSTNATSIKNEETKQAATDLGEELSEYISDKDIGKSYFAYMKGVEN